MFSLEWPRQSNSNEYTQYTIFSIKKKITLNYPKSAAMGYFFQGTQEGVRNSSGKQAISVRANISNILPRLLVISMFHEIEPLQFEQIARPVNVRH